MLMLQKPQMYEILSLKEFVNETDRFVSVSNCCHPVPVRFEKMLLLFLTGTLPLPHTGRQHYTSRKRSRR